MKAKLKKILGLMALGMILLTNTVPTWAGYVSIPGVSIYGDTNSQYATGTMVGARYSADNKQYIGCDVLVYPNEPPSIGCYATNSAGANLLCHSLDPKLVEEFQGVTDSSYVYFAVNRSNGACSRIIISNHSYYLK